MNKGAFIISLDFELHWGAVEKWDLLETKDKFLNTRLAVVKILDLFDRYGIHATWATVGYLFSKDKLELFDYIPATVPEYLDKKVSTYSLIFEEKLGDNENDDPAHYASSLVAKIKTYSNQEVGSHTFSHYYTLEPGQSLEDFEFDIQSAVQIAKAKGVELRSLVFPRNQFNRAYLDVLSKAKFTNVRSNPKNWIWKYSFAKSKFIRKIAAIFRGLDLILPITNTLFSFSLSRFDENVFFLPASRFLRPYSPKEGYLNYLKCARIKGEMTRAAIKGECYHLWWHPHNFSDHLEENLEYLGDILVHYSKLKDKYGFMSLNMAELTLFAKERTAKVI